MLSIVFSKDRPLQLQGYVESLLHNVDCRVTAIVHTVTDQYKQVASETGVEIVEECGLLKTFRQVVASCCERHILLGVDDTVFTKSLEGLDRNLLSSSVFSVTTRVAPPGDGNTWTTHDFDKYSPHGYCFELAGVIYKRHDLCRFAFSHLGTVDTPNDIEVAGVNYFWNTPRVIYSEGVRSLTMHVNRVQHKYRNKFGSLSSHLLSLNYQLGYRLDWESIQGVSVVNPNVEDDYFSLRGPGPVGDITCPVSL